MHPCTWTIATPSDRMRIQSAAPEGKPFEHRSDERRLLEMPNDPQSVRYDADDFLAKLDRRAAKELRLPRASGLRPVI